MKQPQEDDAAPSDRATGSVSSSYVPVLSVDTRIRDDDIMQQHSAIRSEEADKMPFVSDKQPQEEDAAPSDGLKDRISFSYDVPILFVDDWDSFRDNDIMQQHSAILNEEADKMPFVSDKEPISALAAEYQLGSPILLEKIKTLSEQYAAIRRTRGDGNCFFRCFMFAYLEHILESQDEAEVDRITASVEQCKKTLQSLGYSDFTFEDFFSLFLEQLESVLQGNENSISHDELLKNSQDQFISDYVVMFFRFVTSGEIRKRSEFFAPFVLGLTNGTVDQFCKSSVEPMGEESDHVHITALSDALGVPIRVVYLDRSLCDTGAVSANHHDFIPAVCNPQDGCVSGSHPEKPKLTLLYRPGHYDILYLK